MNAAKLLQWQVLIYLLPAGLSALLLLLSSVKQGGHRSGQGGHGGHGGHGLRLHGGARGGHSGRAHATAPKVQARVGKVEVQRHGANRENVTVSANLLLHITGADRAPVAMLLEAFGLVWGLCGYWAEEFTVQVVPPTLRQMLPSLGIALGAGIIGARLAAWVIARVLPPDESQDVSRDGLYGMTGKVVFPVSADGGRIHIYDAHGTLHDETCRLAPDAPSQQAIAKGRAVLVMDMDAQGRLLVEEVSE